MTFLKTDYLLKYAIGIQGFFRDKNAVLTLSATGLQALPQTVAFSIIETVNRCYQQRASIFVPETWEQNLTAVYPE